MRVDTPSGASFIGLWRSKQVFPYKPSPEISIVILSKMPGLVLSVVVIAFFKNSTKNDLLLRDQF
jgi:hypothetical protein